MTTSSPSPPRFRDFVISDLSYWLRPSFVHDGMIIKNLKRSLFTSLSMTIGPRGHSRRQRGRFVKSPPNKAKVIPLPDPLLSLTYFLPSCVHRPYRSLTSCLWTRTNLSAPRTEVSSSDHFHPDKYGEIRSSKFFARDVRHGRFKFVSTVRK